MLVTDRQADGRNRLRYISFSKKRGYENEHLHLCFRSLIRKFQTFDNLKWTQESTLANLFFFLLSHLKRLINYI